eukprot:CAMPEP_0202955668 /NCGR_PEP_ID=MMETSP1396-20130829/206_1 /ASSEMBLY_ACC=CAM_ASM_000872 /TAXON_ID= /ORGANISM="Pseudokeronopsis sp., Strain Brazil" /LENGTH=143 /DNA_ID=CAMNT_0049672333 /DNA_START=282 /DNA_END=713 /DNA_ORIENTATION=+
MDVKHRFYPNELEVQKYFSWFQALMKPASARLIKMYAFPNTFSVPVTKKEIEKEKEEFFSRLLAAVDKQLENKQYLTGETCSVADFLYYNEISTVCSITGRELGSDVYKNLPDWYGRLKANPVLQSLDAELNAVVEKYNIRQV